MITWINNFYGKYWRAIRYVIFALITSALHIGVFSLCHLFIPTLIICNIIAYVFSFLFSFFINKKLIFKNESNLFGNQLFKYLIVKGSSFVIDTIILLILTHWLTIPTILAKLIANTSTTLNNYFLNKKFVFKR